MKKILTLFVSALMIATCLSVGTSKKVYADAHDHTGYTEITSAGFTASTDGNYYLNDDVTLTGTIVINEGVTVNICLNGHTLKYVWESGTEPLIKNNGTLTISSCKDGGNISCENTDTYSANQSITAILNKGTANLLNIKVSITNKTTALDCCTKCIENTGGSLTIENCELSLINNQASDSYGINSYLNAAISLKNSTLNVTSTSGTLHSYGINNHIGCTANLSGNTISVTNNDGDSMGIDNLGIASLSGDSINVSGNYDVYGFVNSSEVASATLKSVSISASGTDTAYGLSNSQGDLTVEGDLEISGTTVDLLVELDNPVTIGSSGITSSKKMKVAICTYLYSIDKTGVFAKPYTAGTSLSAYANYFESIVDANNVASSTSGLELVSRIISTVSSGNTGTVNVNTTGLATSPTYQWSKVVEKI